VKFGKRLKYCPKKGRMVLEQVFLGKVVQVVDPSAERAPANWKSMHQLHQQRWGKEQNQ